MKTKQRGARSPILNMAALLVELGELSKRVDRIEKGLAESSRQVAEFIQAVSDRILELERIGKFASGFGTKMQSLEKQMREMTDIHLAQNRAALREVLARLNAIVPEDGDVLFRLQHIAQSARSAYDAANLPYPPHLQGLINHLADGLRDTPKPDSATRAKRGGGAAA